MFFKVRLKLFSYFSSKELSWVIPLMIICFHDRYQHLVDMHDLRWRRFTVIFRSKNTTLEIHCAAIYHQSTSTVSQWVLTLHRITRTKSPWSRCELVNLLQNLLVCVMEQNWYWAEAELLRKCCVTPLYSQSIVLLLYCIMGALRNWYLCLYCGHLLCYWCKLVSAEGSSGSFSKGLTLKAAVSSEFSEDWNVFWSQTRPKTLASYPQEQETCTGKQQNEDRVR